LTVYAFAMLWQVTLIFSLIQEVYTEWWKGGEGLWPHYHFISYHNTSYHIISYHIISYHIMSSKNFEKYKIWVPKISNLCASMILICSTFGTWWFNLSQKK
jgi:hypothetical protein